MLLVACQAGFSEEGRLAKRQVHAEERTALLCDALDRGVPIDSIRFIAEKDDDLFFYIFDARQMVYWSSNRLAADEVYIYAYDTWRDMHFANAEAKARWTKTNRYNVLTVLPIRYTTEPEEKESKPFTIHTAGFYFYLCIALLGLVFLVGVWGLVRYKGIRNMPLSTRMMYVILA